MGIAPFFSSSSLSLSFNHPHTSIHTRTHTHTHARTHTHAHTHAHARASRARARAPAWRPADAPARNPQQDAGAATPTLTIFAFSLTSDLPTGDKCSLGWRAWISPASDLDQNQILASLLTFRLKSHVPTGDTIHEVAFAIRAQAGKWLHLKKKFSRRKKKVARGGSGLPRGTAAAKCFRCLCHSDPIIGGR